MLLALLFPGQGSQEVGMGRDAFEASAAARAVFEAADTALGWSLSQICFDGPEEDLRRTEIQQPALLTTSIALLRAFEAEAGPLKPESLGGHSLGEYSALVASGAMKFEDAVRTVHARGQFMQEAVAEGEGAMAAVMGCGPEIVREACAKVTQELGQVVAPANYNSPQQTVIAGEAAAVLAACDAAKELGAKRVAQLNVSAPFHCELMAPAARQLRPVLDGVAFGAMAPPVVTNVEAAPNDDPARVSEILVQQVTAPVRFTEMIASMQELGVTHFLEVGAGRVLTGLLARIDRRGKRANLSQWGDVEDVQDFLAN
ncbi:MAG: [acyl-carrier-protein] S-malonyltransferase [bacterium TMED88]|nr:MAG: [acyl-carrier-protein] S-malonyltransferase [bacterium TMED88]